MGARESLQKLLDKKQAEYAGLEIQLREAKAYIQALQDSIRVLPRDAQSEQPELRPNSVLAQTRDFIRNSGHPLHITEILKLLGKPHDKKNRVSIAGTLSSYARSGRIFTKTAPNTFGLVEMNGNAGNVVDIDTIAAAVPSNFGKM